MFSFSHRSWVATSQSSLTLVFFVYPCLSWDENKNKHVVCCSIYFVEASLLHKVSGLFFMLADPLFFSILVAESLAYVIWRSISCLLNINIEFQIAIRRECQTVWHLSKPNELGLTWPKNVVYPIPSRVVEAITRWFMPRIASGGLLHLKYNWTKPTCPATLVRCYRLNPILLH